MNKTKTAVGDKPIAEKKETLKMDKDLIISDIKKSSAERIRLALREYRGSQFLDIRCFYDASNGRGAEWRPTKKGVAIHLEFLSELEEAIKKTIEQAELWSAGNE